jgi:hypothetical protein
MRLRQSVGLTGFEPATPLTPRPLGECFQLSLNRAKFSIPAGQNPKVGRPATPSSVTQQDNFATQLMSKMVSNARPVRRADAPSRSPDYLSGAHRPTMKPPTRIVGCGPERVYDLAALPDEGNVRRIGVRGRTRWPWMARVRGGAAGPCCIARCSWRDCAEQRGLL